MKCVACQNKINKRKGIRINHRYYCRECLYILGAPVPEDVRFTIEWVDGKVEVEIVK